MTSASITGQCRDIAAAIAGTRQALAAGAIVDFSGLDQQVAQLCAAAREVSPDQRDTVVDAMAALADELDRLAADLSRRQAASAGTRATGAYGRDAAG